MDSGHGEEPRGVVSMLTQKSWLHITVTDETAFTSLSLPAKREVAPKILQCGEDPVGL